MKKLLLCLFFGVSFLRLLAEPAPLKTQNVLLVTLDGLRWEEVFRGADESYLKRPDGTLPETSLHLIKTGPQSDTLEERRKKLMPFFWTEVAAHGQLIGNRDRGSQARVANAMWFSYPGYNELLTGTPDPQIKSNAAKPNANITVLEWLDDQPGTAGRVAACTTWMTFPAILNTTRSHFPLWASGHRSHLEMTPGLTEIQRWMDDIPLKEDDEHYDAFAYRAALDLVDTHHPRLLYVALGETDTWAHARNYPQYLEAIQHCDRFVRTLWEHLQSLPQYRGTTTLIVTCDHGRGKTVQDWTDHGEKTPRSFETWFAVLGPDTPPLGEAHDHAPVISAQIAATVAKFLGKDFPGAFPKAAPPIDQVFRQ